MTLVSSSMVPHTVLFDPPVLDRGRHQHRFHTRDREHVLILYAYGHPRLLGVSHKLEAVRVGNGSGPDSKPGAKPGPMNVVAQPLALVRTVHIQGCVGHRPEYAPASILRPASASRRWRGLTCLYPGPSLPYEKENWQEKRDRAVEHREEDRETQRRKPPHAEDRTTKLTTSMPRGKAVIFFRFRFRLGSMRFRLGFTASCMFGECSNFGQPVSTFSPKYTRMAW